LLCANLPADASAADILRHDVVRGKFLSLLRSLASESTGSSNRVARAIVAEEPPSLDAGEITDKGSFNQRAVLDRRKNIVEQLYAPEPPAEVLTIES
jgi:feruloyl-CoA synthase